MKKASVLIMVFIFSLTIFLLTSCEAANIKKAIIGKWFNVKYIDVQDGDKIDFGGFYLIAGKDIILKDTIEFLKDGTVIVEHGNSSVGDYKFIGSNRLRLDIKDGSAKVFEISLDKENALILRAPNGEANKYLTEKAYKAYKAKLEAKLEAQRKAEEARRKKVVEELELPLEKRMIFVKGGCFQMGDTFGDGRSDEKPVHEVCVDDFYMGKYEVTQKEWQEIMGNNPSHFKGCDDCPVEQVSWNDIQDFINKLNQKTGKNYKLPTEAEWEYAARSGGKNEKWAGTSNESELTDYAWYDKNSGSKTHPVGTKQPNGLGIYDMSGNVWEWVHDRYDSSYYKNSPKNNPKGPNSGSNRILRGGSWYDEHAGRTRAAYRDVNFPDFRFSGYGFRVLRTQ